MLLRYRLELLLVVLIGMHMHANHIVLTTLFLGLIFIIGHNIFFNVPLPLIFI